MTQYYSKDFSDPKAQALRDGEPSYSGTTGPYPDALNDPKKFLERYRKSNPYVEARESTVGRNFISRAVFSADTAMASQEKFDNADGKPKFKDPRNVELATDWANKYASGVNRGLIPEEDKVDLSTISAFQSKQPMDMPSKVIAGKIPGSSGVATS
jgi:hypothetical protein